MRLSGNSIALKEKMDRVAVAGKSQAKREGEKYADKE